MKLLKAETPRKLKGNARGWGGGRGHQRGGGGVSGARKSVETSCRRSGFILDKINILILQYNLQLKFPLGILRPKKCHWDVSHLSGTAGGSIGSSTHGRLVSALQSPPERAVRVGDGPQRNHPTHISYGFPETQAHPFGPRSPPQKNRLFFDTL